MNLYENKPEPFVQFQPQCKCFGGEPVSYSDMNWQEWFKLIQD